ncbi:hypothetical protein SAMN02745146_1385 [Hymenobacter daecheongensis DSM 21074]|uniref:Adhesin domain-containing protein n=1 Tax=Hymenobacter daecheongensis DSM 21074 TaxID=1121955 RepID=A0A1M6D5R6_9BACT|nr:hypothetical protein [Hymenobacter daecheongensis]SHI68567.1 hypothetical protein SAMN02745146_1385 [Hymenobacter daecheongensis DSM 21074]
MKKRPALVRCGLLALSLLAAGSHATAAGPQNGSKPPEPTQTAPSAREEAQPTLSSEKNRRLSRIYPAVAGRSYAINTRYGRVQINTWSRNEIRTDVEMISRADTDEKAQQLLDMMQVSSTDQDAETGGVAFRSHFGAMPRACWSRTKLYEVNYTVWLPKNTPLRVHTAFGEISIADDLTGSTDLAVEYGTLRTGRLEGPQNLLRVGNGQATVSFARKASIEASYSKLRLDEGQAVTLRNNYSDIDIGTVQDLNVQSKYGEVALGTVRTLRGTSGYSRFSIDRIEERLDMAVQYCPSFEVRTTGRNFRAINVDGGYSTILLNFPDGTGFNFDVNTQHGKLLVDKRLVKVDAEENSVSSSDMQGRFGVVPVRNAALVNVKVRYGDVRFNR